MAKSNHPLWNTWKLAQLRGVLGAEWSDDFHAFCAVVGDKPKRHRIERRDRSKPLAPGNWYWRPPVSSKPVYPDRVAYNKLHYEQNRDYHRNKHYRKKYGMSLEEYERRHSEQNGVCAICKREETSATRGNEVNWLTVDHCHNTGTVRGLLCNACNRGIGYLADSPQRLRAAAEYLERHGEQNG